MTHQRRVLLTALFAIPSQLDLKATAASSNSQIQIILFGQPCMLQGPFDSKALQEIHSISPEEIYPTTPGKNANLEQARKALEKIRALKSLPAALTPYRDRLIKRLEAQLNFFTALNTYKKDKNIAPLIAA